jgi:AsmA protein
MRNDARVPNARPHPRDPRRPQLSSHAKGAAVRQAKARGWTGFMLWPVVALATLAAGAASFIVVAAPAGLVRDHIVEQFKRRTGHELTVEGGTSISFWPRFSVSMTDVVVSAAPGFEGAPLARISEIEASVRLWPLLNRRVEIEHVTVERPQIELRIDESGRRSWEMAGPEDRRTRTATAEPVAAAAPSERLMQMAAPTDIARSRAERVAGQLASLEVRVRDGVLRYSDPRTPVQEEASGIDLSLSTGAADEPITLTGSFRWHDEDIGLQAEVASLRDLLGREPSFLSAKLKASVLDAEFQGHAAVSGPVRLDGTLALEAPDLRRLAGWIGTAVPEGKDYGALSVAGQLQAKGDGIELSRASIRLSGSTARGLIAVSQGAQRPHLTADLDIDQIDFNAFSGRQPQGGARRVPAGEPGDGPSADLLDLSALTRVDADVRLGIGGILHKDLKIGRTALAATLSGGVLRTNVKEAELYGGRGGGTVDIDASGPVPAFEARLVLEEVEARSFLEDRAGFDGIDGRARIGLALAGEGQSERQMVEALRGTAELKVNDGALLGIDIPRMIRTLKEGRIPSFERAPGDRTPFHQLTASFTLEKGTARTSDLKLVSPLFAASGSGNTDLARRQIDYSVRAHLTPPPSGQGGASQALAGLELPLRITGPWRAPKITADLGGIVKNPDRVVDTAKEIGRQFKGKSIDEAVRGLLGKGTEEENAAGQKAKDLLKGLLR